MNKILTLTSKDFLSGMSEYISTSNYGLWEKGQMNPYSRVGTIQPASAVSDLTNSTFVVDKVQSFVQNNADLYGLGEGGNFYKVTDIVNGLGTITNLRSGSLIQLPATGFEIFQTKVGATPKIYYWRGASTGSGYIGEYNIVSNIWNDTLCTISPLYPSANHPILRVDDVVFFGSGYVVSKIYDDGSNANPALLDNILDLPTDHNIVSLETDGTYLIIAAQITNSNETKIYFWDYKNKLDSWTLEYTIRDTIGQMEIIKGIIYATGKNGFYAFNSGTEPTKIRSDIKTALNQGMARYNDGLFVAGTRFINSYGSILPNVKSGVFTPFATSGTLGLTSMIIPSYINTNTIYYSIYDGSNYRIKSQSILNTPSDTLYQSLNLISSVMELGQSFIIKRVDVTFRSPLASGQTVNSVLVASTGGAGDGVTFNRPTFSDYGAVRKCELYPTTTGEMITDNLSLQLADSSGGLGTNAISKIEIYGEPSIK